MEEKNKPVYTELLKMISVLGIVAVSVISAKWSAASIGSVSWIFMTAMQSALRFSFPVMVMISGIKYLSVTEAPPIKKLYSCDILRLFVSLAFWSILYVVIDSLLLHNGNLFSCLNNFAVTFLTEKNHLWLLCVIIGLVIVSPLLKKIAADKKLLEYFLLVWIAFTVIGNILLAIPDPYINFQKILRNIHMSTAIHFSGYFCLGHYLAKYDIKKPLRILIYFSAGLSVVFFAVITYRLSAEEGKLVTAFLEVSKPTTVLIPASVFLFAKNVFQRQSTPKAVAFIAEASFGVYLCHEIVLNVFTQASLLPNDIRTVYRIVITTAAVYLISLAISAILSFIPFVKKYITPHIFSLPF